LKHGNSSRGDPHAPYTPRPAPPPTTRNCTASDGKGEPEAPLELCEMLALDHPAWARAVAAWDLAALRAHVKRRVAVLLLVVVGGRG
jgi:hypothetical protein